jgi:hypothetical protein
MTITICHNPACDTSRNVLTMIRQSSEEPVIIEYLSTIVGRAWTVPDNVAERTETKRTRLTYYHTSAIAGEETSFLSSKPQGRTCCAPG